MLTPSRIFKCLRSIGRIPEIANCFRTCEDARSITLGFLGLRALHYPYTLRLKSGKSIVLSDWCDLTTAWVVFFGNEYRVSKSDKIIIDLGANIGAFVLFAHSKSPDAKVIAVEPFPENYERLLECVSTNNLRDYVSARSCAIAGSDGIVSMNASPEIPSHSRKISDDVVAGANVEVESQSLESFLEREKIDEVDFLKMDIEGAEYDVLLKSNAVTLRKFKRIGLEYHSRGIEEIERHLATANFAIAYQPKRGASGVVEFERT